MPSFDEYKEIARGRGALAFEAYVVTSHPLVSPEEFSKHLPDHLKYIAEQERLGTLMMSGPLSDTEGTGMSGIGFQVWRASDWQAAKLLADNDPMHVAGVKKYEMRRWLINEGNMSMSIGLSSRSIALD